MDWNKPLVNPVPAIDWVKQGLQKIKECKSSKEEVAKALKTIGDVQMAALSRFPPHVTEEDVDSLEAALAHIDDPDKEEAVRDLMKKVRKVPPGVTSSVVGMTVSYAASSPSTILQALYPGGSADAKTPEGLSAAYIRKVRISAEAVLFKALSECPELETVMLDTLAKVVKDAVEKAFSK